MEVVKKKSIEDIKLLSEKHLPIRDLSEKRGAVDESSGSHRPNCSRECLEKFQNERTSVTYSPKIAHEELSKMKENMYKMK